jgi:transcriptional regulator with XRE-family HTH domain
MIGENLKLLRKRKGVSQEEIAQDLGLTRSSYSGYENGVAEPNIETLIKISEYYDISLDKFIKRDLGKISEKDWDKIDRGIDADLEGKHLRIIATTVDQDNNENIELDSRKSARRIYQLVMQIPNSLVYCQHFNLPFLKKGQKVQNVSNQR